MRAGVERACMRWNPRGRSCLEGGSITDESFQEKPRRQANPSGLTGLHVLR